MRRGRVIFVVILTLALVSLLTTSSVGCILKNNCSTGFRRWFYGGDVEVNYHSSAVLGDNETAWSYLYSLYYLNPGRYQVSFDIKNELSPIPYGNDSPPYAFLDSFYASIFFRDDPGTPEPEQGYQLIPLFDLDANGITNNCGDISASSLGSEWLHFSMTFENTHHYVAPVFELFDWNYNSDDSHVTVANICVSQVPLPSSLILFSGALSLLFWRRNLGSKAFHRRI